jgi:hypothetical protein
VGSRVQALLPFPSVLDMMASDMNWTSQLGNAFLAQQQEVMDAVQRNGVAFRPWGSGFNRFAWDRHTVFINNAPWGRTWVNRGTYVHPYTVGRFGPGGGESACPTSFTSVLRLCSKVGQALSPAVLSRS